MSQAENPATTDSAKRLGSEVYNAGRKLYLFGIGSAAAAADGARGIFDRMVSRGESAEKQVHEDRDSLVNKATGSVKDLRCYVEEKVQRTVVGTLARAGVPSRSEIQDLIARVEELTDKLEAFTKERETE